MDVQPPDERLAKAKKTAILIAKRVGPTAAVLILRRMKKYRAANLLSIGFFALEIGQEIRAALKSGKKDDDAKPGAA